MTKQTWNKEFLATFAENIFIQAISGGLDKVYLSEDDFKSGLHELISEKFKGTDYIYEPETGNIFKS